MFLNIFYKIKQWWTGKPYLTERGFPRSSKWKIIRKEHIKKEPTCQWCGCNKNIEVHHIIPFHIDGSKELDPNNLISLCESTNKCHLIRGHFGNWKTFNQNIKKECQERINLVQKQ